MLSKEKCESALENLEEINLDIVLEELGYEKSERVSIYGINDYPTLEKQGDIEVIRELIKEHFEPQPYNFEDLKEGMWVYDSKPEYEEWMFIKITKILSKKNCEYLYHDKNKKVFFDNKECHAREFEENRFYPVQKANEVKEYVG